jgi:hypothetical protein
MAASHAPHFSAGRGWTDRPDDARDAGALVAWLICAHLGVAHGGLLAAEPSASDRKTIANLLGSGVLGEAVAAQPLGAQLAALHEAAWPYRIVSGEGRGQTEAHVLTP